MNIREERKKFANGKCEICGFKGKELHHIFPGRKNRKISERFETVKWLCEKCHKNIHGKDWKKLKKLQVEACNELRGKIGDDETLKLSGKFYISTESKLKEIEK